MKSNLFNIKHIKGRQIEITIKKRKVPKLVYMFLKKNYKLTIIQWIIYYPYLCAKMWLNGNNKEDK